ncbi:MAG: YqgE/AlgH family protein [Chitinispirillaceae bacterium]|nr:YqgE/AlgH family protein [Chitinispirillaceae bacterium]
MNQPSYEQIRPTAGSEEHLKRLSSGAVLLAREVLHDPNFEATVVLICVHSPDGSYGLVLNRFSHMPLSEIFDGLKGINRSREVLIGGPVQQGELQILQITDSPAEGAYQISQGIYMGGKWDDINSMINSDPENTRLFLGYSGWGPSQLASEIRLGAWDVYKVEIKQLLRNCHLLVNADSSAIASFLQSIPG